MEVQGKIKFIGETKSIGQSGFKKREIIITTEDQFPQHIMVEFVQDKTDLLNSYQVGQQVKININLRGREWVNPQGETKYFNSIQGWRIEAVQAQAPVEPVEAFTEAKNMIDKHIPEDKNDDLPF